MNIQELWDELNNPLIVQPGDDIAAPEHPNYQLIVETDRGPQAVSGIRWEHAAEVIVIELDPDL